MAVKFYYMTQAQYDGSTPNNDYLYFITDNHRLYKGTTLYSESFEAVTEYPTTGRLGCLYINSSDKSVKYYDGSKWNVVIPALSLTVAGTGSASDEKIVTEKAVREAITTAMSGVGGDLLKSTLWISSDSEGYQTGDRTLKDIDFSAEAVNNGDMVLVEENGTLYQYDEDATDDEDLPDVIVPAGGVGRWKKMLTATTYVAGNGISMEEGEISVNADAAEFSFNGTTGKLQLLEVPATKVAVSKDGENTKYLPAALNEKMPKASVIAAGNVLTVDENGNAVDSGKALGGATLATTPNENTLATEAAVNAALTTALASALEWHTA